jgi:nitrate/TMAO reductase-like tetraheme cytochrome c subunit
MTHGTGKGWLGLDPWVGWSFFLGIVVLPVLLSVVTAEVAFERSKTLEFCSSCHTMDPFVNDLKDQNSSTLASKHYQYRRINYNQCYTCHSDYGFLGPVKTKLTGMKHTAIYYLGHAAKHITLYSPFPNANCLQCHEGAKSFLNNPAHQPIMAELRSGEMSCISCHSPAHPPQEGAQ